MASVAVPMITSKAIGMVGEKMGLDPRLTAVASAAGGFGAGTAYSSYSGAKAINAANAAGHASNTATHAVNKGIGMSNARGQGLWNNANLGNIAANSAHQTASQAGYIADKVAIAGQNKAMFGFNGQGIETMHGPGAVGQVAPLVKGDIGSFSPAGLGEGAQFKPLHTIDGPFKPQALKELKTIGPDTNFGEQWDKNIDRWKTRPTDDQGRETGMSKAENLGAEMLSTLMSDLPEEPRPQMIGGGGGGGGGGSAAPYRGGGGFVERKVLSNLGGNRERRFKPQGI